MNQLGKKIIEIAVAYFAQIGEEISPELINLLFQALVDEYKTIRSYPASYTEDMIEEDVERYFRTRKARVATAIIPEMYGKIGAEGLRSLTDNGIVRSWDGRHILGDVLPICEVI